MASHAAAGAADCRSLPPSARRLGGIALPAALLRPNKYHINWMIWLSPWRVGHRCPPTPSFCGAIFIAFPTLLFIRPCSGPVFDTCKSPYLFLPSLSSTSGCLLGFGAALSILAASITTTHEQPMCPAADPRRIAVWTAFSVPCFVLHRPNPSADLSVPCTTLPVQCKCADPPPGVRCVLCFACFTSACV